MSHQPAPEAVQAACARVLARKGQIRTGTMVPVPAHVAAKLTAAKELPPEVRFFRCTAGKGGANGRVLRCLLNEGHAGRHDFEGANP